MNEDLLPQTWNTSCNAMWHIFLLDHVLFSRKLQLGLGQHLGLLQNYI